MTDPTPGFPDHAAAVVRTEGRSPKMLAATGASTLVGVVVALLNGLQDNPSLLGSLPAWLQAVLLIIVPPLLAGLAAYQASPGTISVGR